MKMLSVLLLPVFLAAVGAAPVFAAEGQPVTVSGKVVLVKAASSQVLLAYKKPGAFIETISTFKVDEKTQFKNLGNIAELKINDTVTVNYKASEPGNLIAQSVEKQEELPAPAARPAPAVKK